ncbi:E3 ubiquitin- ligase BOI-like [Olea europaea subsp. europaea]|nr:E3 ubiquitin- ligase BOI-like [Olea europaea subsp. europaea]
MSIQLQSEARRFNTAQTGDLKVVSTGLLLASGEQQPPHLHSWKRQSAPSSILTQDVAHQFKQQISEFDCFLRTQGEELKGALAAKMQKHYQVMMEAAAWSVAQRLREKETEVQKAAKHNAELEARAAQLNLDIKKWQARAREQEPTAATLQSQLHQAMISGGSWEGQVNEHGRTAVGQAENAESSYIDPDRVIELSRPSCKACRRRDAMVVVLPCRHFCLCTDCDAVTKICPICCFCKSSSIQVLL